MKIFTKLILLMIGGLVLTLILFMVLIRPNLNRIQELYATATTRQTELATLVAQITAYKNSQADLNAIQDKNTVIESIVRREDLQVAIEEIEAAAAKSGTQEGLTINELTPDSSGQYTPVIDGKAKIEEVPYVINISGDFGSLLKFLQYLEHLPHFTEVSQIAFKAATTDTSKGALAGHSGNIMGTIQAVFFIQKSKP